VFSATWAADDKITRMKELIESLTRKAGDEILDKKLEKMLDSGGDILLGGSGQCSSLYREWTERL